MAIKENTLPIGSSSGTGTYVRTVSSGGESQRTPFDTFKGAITEDIDDALDTKVDKVTGKGLSTNDFTTAEKNKLAGIQAGAQVNTIETVKVNGTALVPDANKAVNVPAPTVDSALSESSTNPVQNKVVTEAVFDLKEDLYGDAGLAIPFSGSLNNAYITTTGVVEASSSGTKLYFAKIEEDGEYTVLLDGEGPRTTNLFSVAVFANDPVIGSTSLRFKTSQYSNVLKVEAQSGEVIAMSFGGTSENIFKIYNTLNNYLLFRDPYKYNLYIHTDGSIKKATTSVSFVFKAEPNTDISVFANKTADSSYTWIGVLEDLPKFNDVLDNDKFICINTRNRLTINTGYSCKYIMCGSTGITSYDDLTAIVKSKNTFEAVYVESSTKDENINNIIPDGNISGYISSTGEIKSSGAGTKVFYKQIEIDKVYKIFTEYSTISNAFAVGLFKNVPAIGSNPIYYEYSEKTNVHTIYTGTVPDLYLCWSLGGASNENAFNFLEIETKSVNKDVKMGSPYLYKSADLEDEILDSTTTAQVYAFYDALCEDYPEYIQLVGNIGVDCVGTPMKMYRVGWANPFLALGHSNEALWTSTNYFTELRGWRFKKIFLNAGTHGNEKSSVWGVAYAIQEICSSNDDWARYIRSNFVIDVVPVANPSGFDLTTYHNADDVNINRHYIDKGTPEAAAITNTIIAGNYQALIDSHNSGGNANYFGINMEDKRFNTFVRMSIALGAEMYPEWDALAGVQYQQYYPYIMAWGSETKGCLHDLCVVYDIPGYLIETVGVFKLNGQIGVLTPNHKKYCKFTKDCIINSIIALGANDFEE